MRVLVVSSWNTPCGIAEHTAMLRDAVQAADPGIVITVSSEALDPATLLGETQPSLVHLLLHEKAEPLLVHVNHHDGLHSRWTPAYIARLRDRGIPVVVTYHDTYDGTHSPNSAKAKALLEVASAFIVHEPVSDLPGAIYWRQGVAAPSKEPMHYATIQPINTGYGHPRIIHCLDYAQQPILGTIGFNFPWKNFDRLCEETRAVGWAILILSTNATQADVQRWQRLNPCCYIRTGHIPTDQIVDYLAGCTATAFPYECHNTGTSGAIRLGVAARKPVIAFDGCRQFRDLRLEDQIDQLPGVRWVADWPDFRRQLGYITPADWDPGSTKIAERDSWSKTGQAYAHLYRSLVQP